MRDLEFADAHHPLGGALTFLEWRRHAIETCGENLQNVETRVVEWKKQNKFKSPGDSERRITLEKKILKAVSGWKKPDEPSELPKILQDEKNAEEDAAALIKDPLTYLIEKISKRFKPKKVETKRPDLQPRETIDNSRVFEHPDDSYGISVHRITLRQSDKSCPSSYMSYDTDRFPLSKILLASDTNPLTEPCKPDTIRYFHFPANNMHWIEVCLLVPFERSAGSSPINSLIGGYSQVSWRGDPWRIQLPEA